MVSSEESGRREPGRSDASKQGACEVVGELVEYRASVSVRSDELQMSGERLTRKEARSEVSVEGREGLRLERSKSPDSASLTP